MLCGPSLPPCAEPDAVLVLPTARPAVAETLAEVATLLPPGSPQSLASCQRQQSPWAPWPSWIPEVLLSGVPGEAASSLPAASMPKAGVRAKWIPLLSASVAVPVPFSPLTRRKSTLT